MAIHPHTSGAHHWPSSPNSRLSGRKRQQAARSPRTPSVQKSVVAAICQNPRSKAQPPEQYIERQLHANVEIAELGVAGGDFIEAHFVDDGFDVDGVLG